MGDGVKSCREFRRMNNVIWSAVVSASLVISIRAVTVMWCALNPDQSGSDSP